MTTEVVVMNRAGVALAADSAVTVDMGQSSKVRDSALKVFMLSKYRPVGVMVYNNASLLGVPLETAIKLFRKELGRTGHANLENYGDALVDFLENHRRLFPEVAQDRYFVAALEVEYERIADLVEKALASGVYGSGGEEEQETAAETANRVVEERLAFWEGLDDADYYKVDAGDIVGRNSGVVHGVIDRMFLGWTGLSDEARRHLYKIAENLVGKDYFPPDVFTGLVIAGFGEDEHYPVVQHLQVGGMYGNRLKVRPQTLHEVSDAVPSEVLSFAYRDMVDGFLDGISPAVFEHLGDVAAFIREMPVRALDGVAGIAPEAKEKAAEIILQESSRKAAEFARNVLRGARARRGQIDQAVEMLSLKELAQVASTLVGLSSFEHQMSLDREMVGGPVDVAVVSKGDGFIWIDRKHYFPKELNNHFFENYFDGVAEGDEDVVREEEEEETSDGE
ncbi:MAG: hypothetical protein F4029_08380 [Gammaproteobacteria bacterium]|nr:hypothetical protein [Gammaproteobacteria bacterium]MYK46231.1 hypothetical protein [Gammaproteobacteria bacterium]